MSALADAIRKKYGQGVAGTYALAAALGIDPAIFEKDYPMTRLSRDAVRRRLTSDRQRRAFDAASELSQQELRDLLAALEDGGYDSDRRTARDFDTYQRRRAAALRDADDLRRAGDDVNEANPGIRHRDPREYPWNPSNPNFSRSLEPEPIDDEDPGEDLHATIDAELRALKDGNARAWDFMRSRLSDEDFAELRRLILAEPDLDRPPASDAPDTPFTPRPGGTMTSLAHDAALSGSLAEYFPTALLAASRIRIDTVGAPEGPTRRQRIALASSSSRSDRRIENEIAGLAPGALRVRLG